MCLYNTIILIIKLLKDECKQHSSATHFFKKKKLPARVKTYKRKYLKKTKFNLK